MTNMFTAFVNGTPTPQGSKKGFVINGRAILVDASEGNKAWRRTVRDHIEKLPEFRQYKGAVNVSLAFWLPRAKSNTKRQMIQKPDIDKLVRSVMDALTDSSLIEDDSRVVALSAMKRWADDGKPGVLIQVWPSQDPDDTPTT
jgi:Holliday junction resolvase RusA-like endonuclease